MYYRTRRRIFLLGFMLSASLYWGVPDTACPHSRVRESTHIVKTDQQLSLKVPQGQGFVEEGEQHRREEEKKSLPETPKPKTEPAKKEKPVKKFVPSEKIPADQAVDFPADI